jgi:hypothetical protein
MEGFLRLRDKAVFLKNADYRTKPVEWERPTAWL